MMKNSKMQVQLKWVIGPPQGTTIVQYAPCRWNQPLLPAIKPMVEVIQKGKA